MRVGTEKFPIRVSCVFSNGAQYTGEWLEGSANGYGHIRWPDGSYYEGQFFKSQLHGHGTVVIPKVLQYTGQWNLGSRSGFGTQVVRSGKVQTGIWKEDVLVNDVVRTYFLDPGKVPPEVASG